MPDTNLTCPRSGPAVAITRKRPASTGRRGSCHTEIAAVVDLHRRLTGMERPTDDPARREALNRRLRQAFYQGLEDTARRSGQAPDEAQLGRMLRRYPGDVYVDPGPAEYVD